MPIKNVYQECFGAKDLQGFCDTSSDDERGLSAAFGALNAHVPAANCFPGLRLDALVHDSEFLVRHEHHGGIGECQGAKSFHKPANMINRRYSATAGFTKKQFFIHLFLEILRLEPDEIVFIGQLDAFFRGAIPFALTALDADIEVLHQSANGWTRLRVIDHIYAAGRADYGTSATTDATLSRVAWPTTILRNRHVVRIRDLIREGPSKEGLQCELQDSRLKKTWQFHATGSFLSISDSWSSA